MPGNSENVCLSGATCCKRYRSTRTNGGARDLDPTDLEGPATELQRTLDEMEGTLDMCSDVCPHCGRVNVFPGFSKIMAYVCQEWGESVNLGPDAS